MLTGANKRLPQGQTTRHAYRSHEHWRLVVSDERDCSDRFHCPTAEYLLCVCVAAMATLWHSVMQKMMFHQHSFMSLMYMSSTGVLIYWFYLAIYRGTH